MERHRPNTAAAKAKSSTSSRRSIATDTKGFVKKILLFHASYGRHELPWRKVQTPYTVLVSELMLQQTQVERVVPKFKAFIERFPTIEALADSQIKDVLILWQGLGYNRRAKHVHQAAQSLRGKQFPRTREELQKLPGIGPYTSGAICAFAYNQPVLFLETNIRAVFIHHFFQKKRIVTDSMILPVLASCMQYVKDRRTWYAALMDYGSHLKRTEGNATRRSATYAKQSTFRGSRRELRGSIMRLLVQKSELSTERIISLHPLRDKEEILSVLEDLVSEGMITKTRDNYNLK